MANIWICCKKMFSTFIAYSTMSAFHNHSIRLRVKAYATLFLAQTYAHSSIWSIPLSSFRILRINQILVILSWRFFNSLLIEFAIVNTLESTVVLRIFFWITLLGNAIGTRGFLKFEKWVSISIINFWAFFLMFSKFSFLLAVFLIVKGKVF